MPDLVRKKAGLSASARGCLVPAQFNGRVSVLKAAEERKPPVCRPARRVYGTSLKRKLRYGDGPRAALLGLAVFAGQPTTPVLRNIRAAWPAASRTRPTSRICRTPRYILSPMFHHCGADAMRISALSAGNVPTDLRRRPADADSRTAK